MRYFGDKEGLFASAVSFDLRLPGLASIAPRKRGEFLARYFVKRWEGPEAGSNPDDAAIPTAWTPGAPVTRGGSGRRARANSFSVLSADVLAATFGRQRVITL
jgi:hypothetical protein